MKITWIEHSSFLLELPQRVLVLDYFGKTRLPLPANKPVTFLASHHHADHYDKAILEHGTDQIWYVPVSYTHLDVYKRQVVDYGFYDQAHLLNFFKKYHNSQRLSFFSKTVKR